MKILKFFLNTVKKNLKAVEKMLLKSIKLLFFLHFELNIYNSLTIAFLNTRMLIRH